MRYIDDDTISLEWTTEDVRMQLENRYEIGALNNDECRKVLGMLLDKHDANIGVSWDVMDVYIDHFLREKREANND